MWKLKGFQVDAFDPTIIVYNLWANNRIDLPSTMTDIGYGTALGFGSTAQTFDDSKEWRWNGTDWIEQHSGQEIEIGANDIVYDNTGSGMTATNIQDAIDELDTADGTLQGQITTLSTTVDTKTTVADIYGLPPTTIAPAEGTTDTLAAHTQPGSYVIPTAAAAGRITDSPITDKGYRMEVKQYRSGTYYRQTIMAWNEAGAFYTRSRPGGTNWTVWYKFEGTQVQAVQSLNTPMTLNLNRNELDSNFDLLDSIPEEEEGDSDV